MKKFKSDKYLLPIISAAVISAAAVLWAPLLSGCDIAARSLSDVANEAVDEGIDKISSYLDDAYGDSDGGSESEKSKSSDSGSGTGSNSESSAGASVGGTVLVYGSADTDIASGKYADFDFSSIPDYTGEDVIDINNNVPMFTDEQKQYSGTYIILSELDSLGRCGAAMACVGQETEPDEKRGDISSIHPTGWVQVEYDGEALYNRSHLLMYALTGLGAEERNLITGTGYFNQTLMQGYESMVLWVVDNENAHVIYRVTPVFEENNLVAKGVLMEAYCVEYPEDCTFCVFVYNIQPGVAIDYATGKSAAQ